MAKQTPFQCPRPLLAFHAMYSISPGVHPEDLRSSAATLHRMATHLLLDGTEAVERSGEEADNAERVYGLEMLHTAETLFELSGAFYAAAAQAAGETP